MPGGKEIGMDISVPLPEVPGDIPASKSSLPQCMMLEMIVGRRPSAEHNPRSAHGPRLLAPSPIREQELLSARFQSVGYSMEDIMEHRTSAELKGFAAVIRPEKLSRKE